MYSEMLNLLYTTCGCFPMSHGWKGTIHRWGSNLDLSTSRFQHIQEPPNVYFIPFSIAFVAHPTRVFFTLFVDYSRVTGLASVCKDKNAALLAYGNYSKQTATSKLQP